MAKAVISYDKDLPEIPERLGREHLPPASYLRRLGTTDQFEIVDGRRPSKLLLVNGIRKAVDGWRAADYPAASAITKRLFSYWFDEDHEVGGKLFRYYFGQREAIETLAYLFEVKGQRDAKQLVDVYGEVFTPDGSQLGLPGTVIVHQKTVSGKRQIRRYLPELGGETIQDLPPEDLARYAFKMATGSGKTAVMAMVAVWSFFNRRKAGASGLSTNFLIVAPNVIVYQRLERDFGSNRIFHNLPLVPPEWLPELNLKPILRGEGTEPDSSANLFLTNIHQLYESKEADWTPANPIEALLGRKPANFLLSQTRPMIERIKDLPDLVVMNDEAHHVHDEDLEWSKSLMAIHHSLPNGVSLWVDFSATPKDQSGTYFPWIVCDYPLAQAVEDRIVKAPLIVHRVKHSDPDPDTITRENVGDAYGDWLLAAVARWKEHYKTYKPLGPRPVLFIMAEKNVFADGIRRWLITTPDTGLKENEVLVIHTDDQGEVRKRDLEQAREVARDIDLPDNRVKVIVSVLMLREGWDVRNVSVVLGLRPFTSSAKILPEQAVGRGLRLMEGISPDRTQTLEVLGTDAFENFVRDLETEGVGIKTVTTPPPPPVRIEPLSDKIAFDIAIPLTQPSYRRNYKRLSDLDPLALDPIYDQAELDEPVRIRLRMDFATIGTPVHEATLLYGQLPTAQELLASITGKLVAKARLAAEFAELYPIVRDYVARRCFGREINLDAEAVRSHLRSPVLQAVIATYLAREVGKLTAEMLSLQLENRWFELSKVTGFTWRRNLPLLVCKKTIFNLVATFNDFEKDFARFLDKAPDVTRFASLGTTEQESGAGFRVDYLKPSGAIGFYHPDWVVTQKAPQKPSWIVETKGRVWDDTPAKDAAITYWCQQVSALTGQPWRYVRVDQTVFESRKPTTFAECTSEAALLLH